MWLGEAVSVIEISSCGRWGFTEVCEGRGVTLSDCALVKSLRSLCIVGFDSKPKFFCVGPGHT